jgi:colicin import membrane protein
LSTRPEESRENVPKDDSGGHAQSRLAALIAWASGKAWARGKINLREPGVAVSAAAHVALLAATLIVFADTRKFDDVAEAIPVEMISDQQFNQITKGEKTAKQVQPKQKAEKIAEATETKPTPPVAEAKRDVPTPPPPLKRVPDPGEDDKPELKPEPPLPPQRVAALPPLPEPPPRPEPKVAKPEPPKAEKPPEPDDPKDAEVIKPQPVPRPKIAEAPKDPTPPKPVEKPKEPTPPKLDQVAKFLEQKKLEEKPVPKPKSGEESTEPKHKLDVTTISRLLSKEAPQARASTGRELTRTAALGAPTASAARMSPSMWAALDSYMLDAYRRCWTYIGTNPDKYIPQIHLRFRPDGSLAAEPVLDNPASTAQTRILADSAMRAVRQCNPLHIPAEFLPYYEEWKARIIRFNNEEMS